MDDKTYMSLKSDTTKLNSRLFIEQLISLQPSHETLANQDQLHIEKDRKDSSKRRVSNFMAMLKLIETIESSVGFHKFEALDKLKELIEAKHSFLQPKEVVALIETINLSKKFNLDSFPALHGYEKLVHLEKSRDSREKFQNCLRKLATHLAKVYFPDDVLKKLNFSNAEIDSFRNALKTPASLKPYQQETDLFLKSNFKIKKFLENGLLTINQNTFFAEFNSSAFQATHAIDPPQKIICMIEEDAKRVHKKWYQKALRHGNLSEEEYAKWGKHYGLEKEANIAYRFSQDPSAFAGDDDWFPFLQNLYVTLAEKELEARKKGIKLDDPLMRIYDLLRTNEIKNYEYKKRYYRYYKRARFEDKVLFMYVSSEDAKIISQYIEKGPLSFVDNNIYFDAFQSLYIAVVRSLQKLRNYSELLEKLLLMEISDDLFTGALDKESELKKYEGFLRNPEIDEAIKRKTVALINAIMSRPKIEPPFLAPERYMERADKKETAKDFLRRVYGKWLRKDEEVLFQDQLRKLDEPLINALKTYCWNNKLSLADLVLPKKVRIDRELTLQAGNTDELERLAAGFRRREKGKTANKQ